MKNIYLFLNGERGIGVAEALAGGGHVVEAVVTAPGFAHPRLSRSAGEHIVCADVNDPSFVAEMAARRPELFLIAGFPRIFKAGLLSLPRRGTINLHGGRLPEYRGGSPLNWQMINGEKEAGVSVIAVDEGIDSGDVLAEAGIPISPTDCIGDLHVKANAVFPGLVLEVLAAMEEGILSRRVQDEAKAIYWHQRSDADGHLPAALMKAEEAERFIRALAPPYPGAFAWLRGEKVRILAASWPEKVMAGSPGRIFFHQGDGPFLVFADRRALRIDEWRIEGRTDVRLRTGDFLE